MVIKIGINGFGRIGRVIFRTCLEHDDLQVTAINDPAINIDYICYLIKFDSTHGKLRRDVSVVNGKIIVNDSPIEIYQQKQPSAIPWSDAEVTYVVEASGMFTTNDKALGHSLNTTVKRVIVTAPSSDVPMVIMGVNESIVSPDTRAVSCTSSTLYCLAPLVKVLEDNFGVVEGFVTSIHAMTPSLKPLDGLCVRGRHWRDHRSIHQNIIPASTGACKALGKIIPSVKDKLSGLAFRVPIVNVSLLDISIRFAKETNLKQIMKCINKANKTTMKNIINVSIEEVVSSDFIGDKYSCSLDGNSSLQLKPNFFKLICWYENEYSYACRVIDTIYFSEMQQHFMNFKLELMPIDECKHQKPYSIDRNDRVRKIVFNSTKKDQIDKEKIEKNDDLSNSSYDGDINYLLSDIKSSDCNKIIKESINNTLSKKCNTQLPKICNVSDEEPIVKEKPGTDLTEIANISKDINQLHRRNNVNKAASAETIAKDEILFYDKSDTNYSKFKHDREEITEKCICINACHGLQNNTFNIKESDYNKSELPTLTLYDNKHNLKEDNFLSENVTYHRLVHSSGPFTSSKYLQMCGDVTTKRNNDKGQKREIGECKYIDLQNAKRNSPAVILANDPTIELIHIENKILNANGDQNLTQTVPKPSTSTKKDKRNEAAVFHCKERESATNSLHKELCKVNVQGLINDSALTVFINEDEIKKDKLNEICSNNTEAGVKLSDGDIDFIVHKNLITGKNMNSGILIPDNISSYQSLQSSQLENLPYNNLELKYLKHDIYDKLDSVSATDSENSFQINEKKSQVINIKDITNSIEDMAKLNQICKIIEISDELSDKLFSPLNELKYDNIANWSFKDLCQKINLDEFCDNIFGANINNKK